MNPSEKSKNDDILYDSPKTLGTIVTFRGKHIKDMSRQELIKALNIACDMNRSQQKEHSRQKEFLFSML